MSKAIVEKCQAEGLDVKNHMTTISAGLAATIREWFSEGEHTTTVERAERVDLDEVRVKPEPEPEPAQTATAVEEVPAESAPIEAPAEQAPEEEAPAETEPSEPPAEPGVAAEAPTEEAAEAPEAEAVAKAPEADEAKPEEPKKPESKLSPAVIHPPKTRPEKPLDIKPAGPMLDKPRPASLSGPNVIRMEKVEPDAARRPRPARPKPRPRHDAPMTQPLMEAAPGAPVSPDSVKKGKKASKSKTHGRHKASDWEDDVKGKGRRMHAKDIEERQARLAAARGESLRAKPSRKIETRRKGGDSGHVERPESAHITEPITVKELSSVLAIKTGDIIGKLMGQGVMATANQVISTDVAELISLEFGTELIVERKKSQIEQIKNAFDSRESKKLVRRPPVVTMLGHVDHGKTSLLDRIRQSDVAAGEAGGITQHIGAYQVVLNGKRVTFLDTPGHEAFTAMRARGANMTDIVVLVVAADDGLMPQTIEAIHHAKAAEVEIIVALNKIDLPGCDINRIYGQLAEHELTPSEWSGNTEIVKTSAVTGQGIEDLIEHLDYIADLKEYKADPTLPATGWVVEAKMTTTQGAVATVLIKEGRLQKGDIVLAGRGYGRVRTLKDSYAKVIKEATCGTPVEISGLSDVPQAGDRFFVLEDINTAKAASEEMQHLVREESLARRSKISLDNLFSHIEAGNIQELNLIVRADVQGSVDVLVKYLTDLSTDEVKVKVLHAAVGGITEGDVVLAEASGAIIIGFNVVPDERVKALAESKGIDIRLYSIIYKITEDVKDAMSGLLSPEIKEEVTGSLVVRNTFKISGVGTIAGCYVRSGVVTNKSRLRLIRDNIVIKDNCVIDSLKHFKDDVREVKAGLECGIKIVGYDDLKIDDVFEAYKTVEVARTL